MASAALLPAAAPVCWRALCGAAADPGGLGRGPAAGHRRGNRAQPAQRRRLVCQRRARWRGGLCGPIPGAAQHDPLRPRAHPARPPGGLALCQAGGLAAAAGGHNFFGADQRPPGQAGRTPGRMASGRQGFGAACLWRHWRRPAGGRPAVWTLPGPFRLRHRRPGNRAPCR